jgi:hypothetical protein
MGPNRRAFEKIFDKSSSLEQISFSHAHSNKALAKAMSDTPNAVVILECQNSSEIYSRVAHLLEKATVVAVTGNGETAMKLASRHVFEIVMEDDPGWRLLSALRNGVERSVFHEFMLCDAAPG